MIIDSALSNLLPALELNEYELRVYAAAVELGRATAAILAKKTRIPRTSVYSALERLKEKGLVAQEQQRGVGAFIAAGPQVLVRLAEERLAKSQAALVTAKEVSRMLESARSRDVLTSSKVLIFEGAASVKAALDEGAERWRDSLLASGRSWAGFQDESYVRNYGHAIVDYWERFKDRKYEARNQLRLFQELGPISRQMEKRLENIVGSRRLVRELPGIDSFTATLWVVGEYVIILKTRSDPHYLMQIRDPLLAENFYAVFDKLWQLTEGGQTQS
ncbi:MAG: helix-turn-helix domain-containing protein [Oligoflexia bacterium]|nr:helix-turn-helix domain-containing protein [Oligoflexia bacterium]